jgi:hypothetical protein
VEHVMNISEIKHFLAWSTLINYVVLIIWFVAFIGAHDWLYRLHGRWFKLSRENFDAIHYAGMAVYKIGVLLFNLVLLIVFCIIS